MINAIKKLLFWRKKYVLWSEFENICAKYNELSTGYAYRPQKPSSAEFGGFCDALLSQVDLLQNAMKIDLGKEAPYALRLAALELRLAGFALRITMEKAW